VGSRARIEREKEERETVFLIEGPTCVQAPPSVAFAPMIMRATERK